ncbi:hypothetical protein [uncultured Lacinutrix sp.]|uniref:hypothetical protein n=1 Tax=uncultured Lacinutrix sp. TaxID=574032 RepID=UPI002607AA34|nr:hypothetical protein [uncultured Lacinutrix sp.]
MKISIYLSLLILFSISCNQIDNRTINYTDNSGKSVNKNNDEASLLIGYYDIYKRKSSLLRYKLVNGILQSVDTLNTFSSDSVYYSKINRILKNRYIITGVGDIIDIKTNSILKTENSTFSYSKGDSLIFYLDKPNEYGLYNLKNRTYKKVSDSFFSSNRKYYSSNNNYKLSVENHTNKKDFAHVIEIESTELNKTSFINQNNLFQKKIFIENRNGTKEIVVKNAGVGTLLKRFANAKLDVPMLWIDNTNFLYSHINKNKATIKLVNIENSDEATICSINDIEQSIRNAYFFKDIDKNIIYSCEKGKFKINISKMTCSEYEYENLGHNFYRQTQGGKLFYRDTQIGELPYNQKSNQRIYTRNSYLAMYDGTITGKINGLKIWHSKNNKWLEIKTPHNINISIIGWLTI